MADVEGVNIPAAEAGEEAERAGEVVVDSLLVDDGAQATAFNALWNLRTGP
jgi:hypothetical protein